MQDERDLPATERAKYTGIALDKAERLEDLINEFFDITRFSLTSVTLDRRSVNLSRMLEQIADEFIPMLHERGLTCAVNAPAGVMISCDPDKLQRVFDNLLRNAINYSYENTEITISLSVEGERARITFMNHGDTIPAAQLDRLFEQFYRLDSARQSRTGGSGLGLAIAKEIVELHGGSISAQSVDNRIVFSVTLPLGDVRKRQAKCLALRRDIQAVILQQPKDQPNQFSGSQRECAFMLVLVDLMVLEVIVAPELGVASSHRVGGFQQIVAEVAVAGLNHLGVFGLKITGLVFVPDKTGKLRNRCLRIEAVDIAKLSDNTGRVDLSNAGDRCQGV